MRLTRTWNAGHDNLYLNKEDVDRLLKGQMIKESSLIVQMEKSERDWVGLTDKELDDLHRVLKIRLMGTFEIKDIYRAIEQQLKERNT
jgi:hypothetical protein